MSSETLSEIIRNSINSLQINIPGLFSVRLDKKLNLA